MTTTSLAEVDADVVVAGLADGASLPVELADARGAAAAKSAFKKVAVLHPDEPATALVVGLGEPAKLDPERLRVAAAIAAKRAAGLDAKSVAWALPGAADAAEAAAAIVEGTILAGLPVRPLLLARGGRAGAGRHRAAAPDRRDR